jgi:hypothetical protein
MRSPAFYSITQPGRLFITSLGSRERPDWLGEWLGTEMFFSHYDATRLVQETGFIIEHAELIDPDNDSAPFPAGHCGPATTLSAHLSDGFLLWEPPESSSTHLISLDMRKTILLASQIATFSRSQGHKEKTSLRANRCCFASTSRHRSSTVADRPASSTWRPVKRVPR